jgi:adenylosuccinate lyase
LIDRYTRPQMAKVWSEEAKLSHWLRIEILATEARVGRGDVPKEDLEEIKAKASFDPARVKELERKTRHDVAAFLDNVAETVGPASRHLHYGMTSSDILDTTLALQMREAAGIILEGLEGLIDVTIRRAHELAGCVMAGRTHGIHAEPTTLGLKLAGWAFELDRGRSRVQRAREAVSVGKLSGAVGTYSGLDPAVESQVCRSLDLEPDPSSTQVISRDRHAEYLSALAILAGSLERIATEIRHLARTEVGEIQEPFAEGEQKGSSAMPHKRNPWRSERLCGLARMVRAAVTPAVENIALWHERDISHSSVERVMLPDACALVDFMIAEATELVGGLVIHPERMRQNIEASHGVMFSQNLLLKLVDSGMLRDEAYRLVQNATGLAWSRNVHLREVVGEDPEITSHLKPDEIDSAFDEARYVEKVDKIIARLSRIQKG